MQLNKYLEQHIAVFGESGSGKTVMLSSFYGAAQEPTFLKNSLFRVVADDIGQGNRLHKNYLGMRDSARRPETTRFTATSYSFSVKLKASGGKAAKSAPFDALRLVWHDYPGDWFEQDVSGPEEHERRVNTFRALLNSDVALLLVDGQKLLDNAGEEERYLRSLIGNFRNGLSSLKAELLDEGKPLVKFPRIWVLALSKSDLLPETDVFDFRDLVIEKACDDIEELRATIAEMVESSQALSVAEDFLLLSSAKFEPGRIKVTERVGVDLILPLAAMLPLERHTKWIAEKQLSGKVVEELAGGLATLAAAVLSKLKFKSKFGQVAAALLSQKLVNEAMIAAAKLIGEKLSERHQQALAAQDFAAAVLTGFQLDLEAAEDKRILHRSLP